MTIIVLDSEEYTKEIQGMGPVSQVSNSQFWSQTHKFIGSCTTTYNFKLTSLKTSYAVNKIVNIIYLLAWSKYVPVESALKLGPPGSQVIYVKSNMYQEAIFCNHMSVIGYFKDSWNN